METFGINPQRIDELKTQTERENYIMKCMKKDFNKLFNNIEKGLEKVTKRVKNEIEFKKHK